jgi:hypothetical protein
VDVVLVTLVAERSGHAEQIEPYADEGVFLDPCHCTLYVLMRWSSDPSCVAPLGNDELGIADCRRSSGLGAPRIDCRVTGLTTHVARAAMASSACMDMRCNASPTAVAAPPR